MPVIRTPYKGRAPRCWLPVRVVSERGDFLQFHALVDTGCPFALVVTSAVFDEFSYDEAVSIKNNFGWQEGGWFIVEIPEISFRTEIIGYRNDSMVSVAQRSHPSFQGVLGLPILRLGEYGGNKDEFWFQHPHTTGINP